MLVLLVAAIALALAGDTLAGDKKDKKDKKNKGKKKEEVIKKDNERTGAITDPTRANKSISKEGNNAKGQGSCGNSSGKQSQTRNQKQAQKKCQKRSSKSNSGGKR
jgi:hypothetical protein